ncbi:hypothetical protein EDC18_11155 [Natranaerovirga pectinivora]|uniref:Uncharacterized protein n=1 Tax=Natranaerovirga pectinivora TaxID=682400 RepID=A0A4R3MGK4_9FIRM|nr:hypothetical protein [Natranaerovirga pectinivora]TCT12884.1 hypothetical protein EDC18_11155 [Natranaerovirga pectinivora]
MITAYLVGISKFHEEEDIEIRYSIYKDDELICKKSVYEGYKKPLVVTHYAVFTLLKELEPYKREEINVIVNDPAFIEQVRGTSTSKNKDVIKVTSVLKDRIRKFKELKFTDISQKHQEVIKWDNELQ